jgi:hypothetical protein
MKVFAKPGQVDNIAIEITTDDAQDLLYVLALVGATNKNLREFVDALAFDLEATVNEVLIQK